MSVLKSLFARLFTRSSVEAVTVPLVAQDSPRETIVGLDPVPHVVTSDATLAEDPEEARMKEAIDVLDEMAAKWAMIDALSDDQRLSLAQSDPDPYSVARVFRSAFTQASAGNLDALLAVLHVRLQLSIEGWNMVHNPFEDRIAPFDFIVSHVTLDEAWSAPCMSDPTVPLWQALYETLRFEGRQPQSLLLLPFVNAGFAVTDELVDQAVEHDARTRGTVETLIAHAKASVKEQQPLQVMRALFKRMDSEASPDSDAWNKVMGAMCENKGNQEVVRLLIGRGMRLTSRLLGTADMGVLPMLIEEETSLRRLVGAGDIFRWRAHTPDETIERFRVVLSAMSADDLNALGEDFKNGLAFPIWFGMFKSTREECRNQVFEQLLAKGADITRRGVASHFSKEMTAVLHKVMALSWVAWISPYLHEVEVRELRKAADEVEQETAPFQARGRKRL